MPSRTRSDSGSHAKRRRESSASHVAPERRSCGDRSTKVPSARDSSDVSDSRFAGQLRRKFFDRQRPADVIVVLAARRPDIINRSEPDGWQIEKFSADFAQLRSNGALPEDMLDAMKMSLDNVEGEQKNPIGGFKDFVKGAAEVAPQISSIVAEARNIFGFGKKKEPTP